MRYPRWFSPAVVFVLGSGTLLAQVSGTIFHDRNANGIKDSGEEALESFAVQLLGQRDAGGAYNQSSTTTGTGTFNFNPGNGCYLLGVPDPAGWRRTLGRTDEYAQGTSGYTSPVGVRRYGGTQRLLQHLQAGSVLDVALGDSIAVNFNTCFDTPTFWYEQEIRDRLRCVAPAASVTLDQAAISGEDSDDLLVDEPDGNNVFRTIDKQPHLVTISIIGNDLLDNDPADNATQAEKNAAAAELIDSRQNLQEILSSLTAEIPHADIEINTLYDNLARECSTRVHRREWTPILQQMLRDLAWGQVRRATNADAYADLAHVDLSNGCYGFRSQICTFIGDGIHPRRSGYTIIREKLWESLNGVNLGSKDALGATSLTLDQGFLKQAVRLLPTQFETRGGASVTNPSAAFSASDGGAGASITLGIGNEEVRFAGFPTWYDEVTPTKVIAGVVYRTTGTVSDDFYRVEASINDQFRPPAGHNYSPTDWIYFTPLVGSGGPNNPPEDPDFPAVKTLVRPNVANLREASATLMKNATRPLGAARYEWPAVTTAELGTTTIRVAAAPVSSTPGDAYQVVVDYVYLDVYGPTKPRPGEIQNVRAARPPDGSLEISFDALPSAERYNLYFGSLSAITTGSYNHVADARCNVSTTPAGPGRLLTSIPSGSVPTINSYFLVTGRVDGVESPTGLASNGSERDRSQNTCP